MRAGAMAVVVLVAIAAGRPGGGVAALCLAVIVLLTVDPWYARDYGFALSVCATAGLLLLAAAARPRARAGDARAARRRARRAARRPTRVPAGARAARPRPGRSTGCRRTSSPRPLHPSARVVGLVGCLLLPVLPSVGIRVPATRLGSGELDRARRPRRSGVAVRQAAMAAGCPRRAAPRDVHRCSGSGSLLGRRRSPRLRARRRRHPRGRTRGAGGRPRRCAGHRCRHATRRLVGGDVRHRAG